MPISPITPPALSGPTSLAGIGQVPGVSGTDAVSGDNGFGDVLAAQVDSLQGMHTNQAQLAQAAATGDVKDVHDYMIAATETQLATETVVALRNKAVEAFNEILRMPV